MTSSAGPAGPDQPGPGPAARRWSARLAAWAIPRDILVAAPRPPWFVPPDLLRAPACPPPDTPSTGLARAAVPAGGGVLDVGCGGGRAGLALAPPAGQVTGVDRDAAVLVAFRAAAAERGVRCTAVHGEWPAVADDVTEADVAVCHHVLYHVSDLGAFGLALDARARRRVVLEMRAEHPLAALAPLWRQFWGLDRPAGPTAADALAVLRETGLAARRVAWLESPATARLAGVPFERQVELARIRLCLPSERDAEVAAALRGLGPPSREAVTIWWDPSGDPV